MLEFVPLGPQALLPPFAFAWRKYACLGAYDDPAHAGVPRKTPAEYELDRVATRPPFKQVSHPCSLQPLPPPIDQLAICIVEEDHLVLVANASALKSPDFCSVKTGPPHRAAAAG